MPGLIELMGDIEARRVRLVEVTTPEPSPFARSLLFGYVAQFLYEGDSPLAERRAAALSLDSRLLAELLGQAELRELLDPDVLAELERELQWLTEDRRIKDVEGVADLLRVLGPLTDAELAERGAEPDWAGELGAARRAIRVRIARRRALGGDRGRRPAARRAGHGAAGRRPGGVHRAGQGPAGRSAGPVRPHPRAVHRRRRPPRGSGSARPSRTAPCTGWPPTGGVVQGEFRPGGAGPASGATRRCCGGCGAVRWRRCGTRWSRCRPPRWPRSCRSGSTSGRTALRGIDGLVRAVEQLQGAAVPASALETAGAAVPGGRTTARRCWTS